MISHLFVLKRSPLIISALRNLLLADAPAKGRAIVLLRNRRLQSKRFCDPWRAEATVETFFKAPLSHSDGPLANPNDRVQVQVSKVVIIGVPTVQFAICREQSAILLMYRHHLFSDTY
jgi:hypothetical protein